MGRIEQWGATHIYVQIGRISYLLVIEMKYVIIL